MSPDDLRSVADEIHRLERALAGHAALADQARLLADRVGRLQRPPRRSRGPDLRLLAVGQSLASLLLIGSAFARVGRDASPQPPPDETVADVVSAAPAAPEVARPPPAPVPTCDEGQPCRPIEVSGPVFTDEGDTRGSTESAIAVYGCAPDIAEGGPEVWYRADVARAGTLTARIDEDTADGVDVDVQILSAPDPARCLARGNAVASARVGPGTYFVLVDTCTIDGLAKPGPYRLTVEVP